MNTGELITHFRRRVRRRSAWAWGLVVTLVSTLLGAGYWFRDRLIPTNAAAPPDVVEIVPAGSFGEPPRRALEEASIETAPVTVSALPEDAGAPVVAPSAASASGSAATGPLPRSAPPRSVPSTPPASAWPERPDAEGPEESLEPPAEQVRERRLPRLGPNPPRSRTRPPPRTRDYGI
jgi:hypothetical protein